MNNNRIINLPFPNGNNQPTAKAFTDNKYLHLDGSVAMNNNLNMNNKKIIHLRQPTHDTDAANKKYVDDNKVDVSNYLKVDGTNKVAGNLNMDSRKIVNLNNPTNENDAVNKNYVDSAISHSHVKPSHFKDQFSYLMSYIIQWTDDIDSGNSFNMTTIAHLPPTSGNFHTYNHKVIYTTIIKNSQGSYKYKRGINLFTLTENTDYALCIEILNGDYKLWHKTKVSIDRATSHGLTVGNVAVKKISYNYKDRNNTNQFMYCHSLIVNVKKTAQSLPYILDILVDIPQVGGDLITYPKIFTNNYIIAYGIEGQLPDVDVIKFMTIIQHLISNQQKFHIMLTLMQIKN